MENNLFDFGLFPDWEVEIPLFNEVDFSIPLILPPSSELNNSDIFSSDFSLPEEFSFDFDFNLPTTEFVNPLDLILNQIQTMEVKIQKIETKIIRIESFTIDLPCMVSFEYFIY